MSPARRRSDEPAPGAGTFSRRRLLAGSGVLGTGAAAASLLAACSGDTPATGADPGAQVPFHGPHQAGVATPQQAALVFATYDVTAADRPGLAALLATWTRTAARMAAGLPATADGGPGFPPGDTGEAVGLGPSRLTLTVGFGPGLFNDRYGLARRRPAALADLPAFPGDALDPARSGGDLCIQACADDAQVAFHAVHNLTRLGLGAVTLRTFQAGFGFGSDGGGGGPPAGKGPPRNLLGFHDGTANRSVETAAGLDRYVWVGAGNDRPWMHGGTYLVARRIRIALESWARTDLTDQEAAVGRRKRSGAPLGSTGQFDAPRFSALGANGVPVIPTGAHIRQASPTLNGGEQLLRRSYNFADGIDPLTGELDAGLFFVCFQRDPRRQFVPIQRRLAAADLLTQGYLVPTSSAVFACPPGSRPGGSWGESLGLG